MSPFLQSPFTPSGIFWDLVIFWDVWLLRRARVARRRHLSQDILSAPSPNVWRPARCSGRTLSDLISDGPAQSWPVATSFPWRAASSRFEPLRADASRCEPLRADASSFEQIRAASGRFEPLRAASSRFEQIPADSSRCEPVGAFCASFVREPVPPLIARGPGHMVSGQRRMGDQTTAAAGDTGRNGARTGKHRATFSSLWAAGCLGQQPTAARSHRCRRVCPKLRQLAFCAAPGVYQPVSPGAPGSVATTPPPAGTDLALSHVRCTLSCTVHTAVHTSAPVSATRPSLGHAVQPEPGRRRRGGRGPVLLREAPPPKTMGAGPRPLDFERYA